MEISVQVVGEVCCVLIKLNLKPNTKPSNLKPSPNTWRPLPMLLGSLRGQELGCPLPKVHFRVQGLGFRVHGVTRSLDWLGLMRTEADDGGPSLFRIPAHSAKPRRFRVRLNPKPLESPLFR